MGEEVEIEGICQTLDELHSVSIFTEGEEEERTSSSTSKRVKGSCDISGLVDRIE